MGIYQHLHIIRILMLLKDYMLFKIFMDGHQISDQQNTIRKSSKKEFIDPSIAVASLNLTPEKLLKDFETFGFIFGKLMHTLIYWFIQVQLMEKYCITMMTAVLKRIV